MPRGKSQIGWYFSNTHTIHHPTHPFYLFICRFIYFFLISLGGAGVGFPQVNCPLEGFFPSSNRCNFALAPCAGSNKPRRPSSRAQAVTPVWWELHSHLHLPASSFLLGLIPACTGLPLHSQSSLPHPQSWFFFCNYYYFFVLWVLEMRLCRPLPL